MILNVYVFSQARGSNRKITALQKTPQKVALHWALCIFESIFPALSVQ